jgi:ABC-2 type transport system ATP-binding protein
MRTQETPAVHTAGLGKRYGSLWALQDCSVTVPAGRVTALIGPNGAGKTTLLKILAGLSRPSAGEVSVLGRQPGPDAVFLDSIGYLAQDIPLYRRLSAGDHIRIFARLNRHWDAVAAADRLAALNIPLTRAVGSLSGGQRAQVGLSLALAKQPRLLLLDEPVAALDPLARHEFLSSLAEAAAEGGPAVILSSHLLRDLEQVCSHLILLSASRTQLCEAIDNVVATHRVLTGPRGEPPAGVTVVKATHTARQSRLLARLDRQVLDPSWDVHEVTLEDIVLAYMGEDAAPSNGTLTQIGEAS